MRRIALLLLVATCALVAGWANAATDDNLPTPATIRFHRSLVPANRLPDWTNDGSYQPMPLDEFERLRMLLKAAARDAAVPKAALVRARYDGQLQGEQLVGTGAWEVVVPGGEPASLLLEPSNLAIDSMRWSDPAAKETASTVRVFPGLGPNGRLSVVVPRSGTLRFDWSLPAGKKVGRNQAFTVSVPTAAANEWTLRFPKDRNLTVDGHVVTIDEPTNNANWRSATIAAGSAHKLQLLFSPVDVPANKLPKPIVRESRTYECTLRGLEVRTDWSITPQGKPLTEIDLLVDRELQLTSIRLGEAEVPWWVSGDGPNGTVRLTARLPESIVDEPRTIQIAAMAKMPLNRVFRLPYLTSDSIAWEEGTIALVVPETLIADNIASSHCRQIESTRLINGGRSVQFQAFAPDATIDVSLTRRESNVTMLGVANIDVSEETVAAAIAVELSIDRKSCDRFDADVAPGWSVSEVRCMSGEWAPKWSVDNEATTGQRLVVQLPNPIEPTTPVRLVVRCCRAIRPGQVLKGQQFWPLAFRGIQATRRVVAVQCDDSCKLAFENPERNAKSLTPEGLAGIDALLLNRQGPVLFGYADRGVGPEAMYMPKIAKCRARIDVDAVVGDLAVREITRFRCLPEAGGIDRVVVQFTPRRDAEPTWTLDGRACDVLSARRMGTGEQASSGDVAVETWEVIFARPRRESFELVSTRDVFLAGGWVRVALAAMPEAVAQEGILRVRSAGRNGVLVECVPGRDVTLDQARQIASATTGAGYRYDLENNTARSQFLNIRVKSDDHSSGQQMLVSLASLDSWYPDGEASRHTETLQFQGVRAKSVRFLLPPTIQRDAIRSVEVDGEPTTWQADRSDDRSFRVFMPPSQPTPKITIEWTLSRPAARAVGELQPAWIVPDVPILSYESTVWLPDHQTAMGPQYRRVPVASERGWQAWRCERQRELPPALEFVDHTPMRLLGIVVFLFVAAFGCWQINGMARSSSNAGPLAQIRSLRNRYFLRTSVLGVLLCVVGIAILFTPPAYVAMPIGGICGILFSIAWRCVPHFSRRSATHDNDAAKLMPAIPSRPSLSMMILVAVGVLLGIAGTCLAQDGEQTPTAGRDQKIEGGDFEIVVPLDATKKPTGLLYVPESLRDILHKFAAAEKTPRPAWQITQASYQAELAKANTSSDTWDIHTVKAVYRLQVRSRDVRVILALGGRSLSSLPGTVLLNGQTVPVEQDAKRGTIAVPISGPGDYRLEISLEVQSQRGHGEASVAMTIPRVPNAKFELLGAENGPRAQVSSAIGPIASGHAGQLTAELGPSDRLSIRWSETPAPVDVQRPVVAEQFVWMQIAPDVVSVAVRLRFLPTQETARARVRLVVDRRLRLVPQSGEKTSALPVSESEDGSVAIELPSTFKEPVSVELQFTMSGATGVGVLYPPQIAIEGATIEKRWFALSADASLKIEPLGQENLDSLATADFLAAWGPAETPPQYAYNLSSDDARLQFSSTPRKAHLAVDQTLTLSYDDRQVALKLEAACDATAGYVFELQIAAPRDFELTQVSVRGGGYDRIDHWRRDADGTIRIFLNGATTGLYTLLARGQMPVALDRPNELPWLRVLGADQFLGTTEVYRQPSAILAFRGDSDKAVPAQQGPATELGRLERRLAWNGDTPPSARVDVTPNRLNLRGTQAMWTQPNSTNQWSASITCAISVLGGVADEFTVSAPMSWEGPFEVDQPGDLQVYEGAGNERRIVFRPRAPIAGDYTFSIKGKATSERLRSFGLPDIRLLGHADIRRYVIVPSRVGGEPLQWTIANAKPSTVSAEMLAKLVGNYTVYEIPSLSATARLEKPDNTVRAGTMTSAQVELVVQADNSWHAKAVFQVLAGDATECVLRLPPGAELLWVTLKGANIVPTAMQDGQWRIRWSAPRAAQRLDVMYRSPPRVETPNGLLRIGPPRLEGIPARKLIWLVSTPQSRGFEVEQGAVPFTPTDSKQSLSAKIASSGIVGPERSLITDSCQSYLGNDDTPLTLGVGRQSPTIWRQLLGITAILFGLGVIAATVIFRRL